TEKARVVFDPSLVDLQRITAAVEKAGYGMRDLPSQTRAQTPAQARAGAPASVDRAQQAGTVGSLASLQEEPVDSLELERAAEIKSLRLKFSVSLAAGLVMMASMYLPLGINATWLHLALFALATPIQLWAGAGFYRAAWAAGRHLSTNMNTL